MKIFSLTKWLEEQEPFDKMAKNDDQNDPVKKQTDIKLIKSLFLLSLKEL